MNKKDAAQYLGISTRALEYHVTQGNIGRRMVKGKTGDVADFDERELRRLKATLDEKRAPRPSIEREGQEGDEGTGSALARLADVRPAQEFAAVIAEALRLSRRRDNLSPADLAHKLLLSLPECATLAGLSEHHLRQAVKEKKLKAKIIGRGYRVRRSDLEAYVRKL